MIVPTCPNCPVVWTAEEIENNKCNDCGWPECHDDPKPKTDMRFEVKTVENAWKVWDNKRQNFITKNIPYEDVANEICEDFNAMENKDFSAIGLPDLSKIK